jgi:hypothetical protein
LDELGDALFLIFNHGFTPSPSPPHDSSSEDPLLLPSEPEAPDQRDQTRQGEDLAAPVLAVCPEVLGVEQQDDGDEDQRCGEDHAERGETVHQKTPITWAGSGGRSPTNRENKASILNRGHSAIVKVHITRRAAFPTVVNPLLMHNATGSCPINGIGISSPS